MAGTSELDAKSALQASDTPRLARELYPMNNWTYDTFLWSMSGLIDLFFREVHPRGSWRIPRHGPVIFVAAPHANQFVDALILQRTLRNEAGRRVSLLVAEKSVHGFIGYASRATGAVPVGRAQDTAKAKPGTVYLPNPIDDPTLVRGIGTDFTRDAEVGGMLFLPAVKGRSSTSVDIAEIMGPEELRLKRVFKGATPMGQLTGRDDIDDEGSLTNSDLKGPKDGYEGTKFKISPKIDQAKVYEAVFQRLQAGGCIGIFPEGGSHDRTGLLPIKAGVAIMALGALDRNPELGLKIVPVGMNYFHAHKFRSRAVIEFGQPLDVSPEWVEFYKHGPRSQGIGPTLDMIEQALAEVTVQTPDYDTLMLIQAARRLYNPTGKKLPLPLVMELNRRLAMGYDKYKDDPRIAGLSDAVKSYNKQLRYLNIADHQVQYAKMSYPKVIFTFLYRLSKLLILLIGTLPGAVLFAPVFIATKFMSIRKAKIALAGSTVKVQGRDVMATWKILTAMLFAPILYNIYICIFVWRVYKDRLWGYWDYVPDWVPLGAAFPIGWIVFPAITFAALRTGEVGMDIFKSLRPLVMCINPSSSYSIQKLRTRRAELSERVTSAINELGPEIYPDFYRTRIVADPYQQSHDSGMSSPTTPGRFSFSNSRSSTDLQSHSEFGALESPTRHASLVRHDTTTSSRALPRHDSFSNIGYVGIFSTRPPSRSRSRSRSSSIGGANLSSGVGVSGNATGFTQPFSHSNSHSHSNSSNHLSNTNAVMDSNKAGLDEVSRKIRAEMRERGELRRRATATATASGVNGLDDGFEYLANEESD